MDVMSTPTTRSPGMGGPDDPVDCVIVGGGPAGLSAAIYLGRLRRSTLVVDDRAGRSLWSQVNRNYLGFPDGVEAAELRRLGRQQAANYGTRFIDGTALDAERVDDIFTLRIGQRQGSTAGTDRNLEAEDRLSAQLGEEEVLGEREVRARTVILATGVRDRFPEFTGRDECVGRTLFWCIICDGYEALDRHVVVVGADEHAVTTCLQLRQFTDHVTLVAGAPAFEVDASRIEHLALAGVAAFETPVRDYPNEDGCISALVLDDAESTRLPLDLVFVGGRSTPRSELARQLGVEVDRQGFVIVDAENLTNVPGFYAAGDVTREYNHQVSSAVHEGGMAAAAANYELYAGWQKSET
jgi:thioredoxin reductase (NADPH)